MYLCCLLAVVLRMMLQLGVRALLKAVNLIIMCWLTRRGL